MTTDADQTISGATFGPPKIDKFELSETPEQFIENTNSSFRDKYITVPARLDIQGSTGSSQIHFDKFINTNPVPHADGAVFNRKTLIGYTLSKNGLLGHTVAEAGREAILPLNRQVYSEIGEGVLRRDVYKRQGNPDYFLSSLKEDERKNAYMVIFYLENDKVETFSVSNFS